MCKCKNIEIGSHKANMPVPMPVFMNSYMVSRRGARLDNLLYIDFCLIKEILYLWSLGITTTGCCCGHNKIERYIGVISTDIPIMKGLGYKVKPNEMRPGDEDEFIPKRS